MPDAYLNPLAIEDFVGEGADVEVHLLCGEVGDVVGMNQLVIILAGIALRQEERLAILAVG